MSYYDDGQDAPRRHKSGRDRDSRRSRPVYEEDEIIEKRRGPLRQEVQTHRELIRRQDSDDIEEVQRDFPPGEGYGRRGTAYPPRRARSDGRRDRDYDSYGGGRRSRGYDDRRGGILTHNLRTSADTTQAIDVEIIRHHQAQQVRRPDEIVGNRWENKQWLR